MLKKVLDDCKICDSPADCLYINKKFNAALQDSNIDRSPKKFPGISFANPTVHSLRQYGERYKMVSDDSKPAKSAN